MKRLAPFRDPEAYFDGMASAFRLIRDKLFDGDPGKRQAIDAALERIESCVWTLDDDWKRSLDRAGLDFDDAPSGSARLSGRGDIFDDVDEPADLSD